MLHQKTRDKYRLDINLVAILIPCWETTCIDFSYYAHLHPTVLFVYFNWLMLFTNLHFSSIIQSSGMMETNCSSCWCIVSVFATHQFCFCAAKIKNVCAMYTNQTHKKRCCKMFGSSQCWLVMCKHRFCNALLYD